MGRRQNSVTSTSQGEGKEGRKADSATRRERGDIMGKYTQKICPEG